jgi:hypothetical protein
MAAAISNMDFGNCPVHPEGERRILTLQELQVQKTQLAMSSEPIKGQAEKANIQLVLVGDPADPDRYLQPSIPTIPQGDQNSETELALAH